MSAPPPVARAFRFGVVAATAPSAAAWREKARRAEALGYATVLVPDSYVVVFDESLDALAPVVADLAGT